MASGESLKDALTLMNMPLETPNLSAFLSARSFCAWRRARRVSLLRGCFCGSGKEGATRGEGGAGGRYEEGGARMGGMRGNPGTGWR